MRPQRQTKLSVKLEPTPQVSNHTISPQDHRHLSQLFLHLKNVVFSQISACSCNIFRAKTFVDFFGDIFNVFLCEIVCLRLNRVVVSSLTSTPPPQIFDLVEGRPYYTLHGHKAGVLGVDFSPSGEFFSSVGADEQVPPPSPPSSYISHSDLPLSPTFHFIFAPYLAPTFHLCPLSRSNISSFLLSRSNLCLSL